MKTHLYKRLPPLALFTGIVVILFSAAGTAAMAIRSPASTGGPGTHLLTVNLPAAPAEPDVVSPRTKTKCTECGVILSMRKIEVRDGDLTSGATNEAVPGNPDEIRAKADRYYEFTILMADRSLRWVNDENPVLWRLGERVVVIDGSGP